MRVGWTAVLMDSVWMGGGASPEILNMFPALPAVDTGEATLIGDAVRRAFNLFILSSSFGENFTSSLGLDTGKAVEISKQLKRNISCNTENMEEAEFICIRPIGLWDQQAIFSEKINESILLKNNSWKKILAIINL